MLPLLGPIYRGMMADGITLAFAILMINFEHKLDYVEEGIRMVSGGTWM